MEKCRLCGQDWPDGSHSAVVCLRRQLAAANERAGRYNEALADIKTNHQHAEYVYDRATMALEVPDA